jgi:hypothetical protein
LARSGSDAEAGAVLLRAAGPAGGLLLAWKVAQTAVEAASGVASEAARIVGALREQGWLQLLACTRKHWPGRRALAACAAVAQRLRREPYTGIDPEQTVRPGAVIQSDQHAGSLTDAGDDAGLRPPVRYAVGRRRNKPITARPSTSMAEVPASGTGVALNCQLRMSWAPKAPPLPALKPT